MSMQPELYVQSTSTVYPKTNAHITNFANTTNATKEPHHQQNKAGNFYLEVFDGAKGSTAGGRVGGVGLPEAPARARQPRRASAGGLPPSAPIQEKENSKGVLETWMRGGEVEERRRRMQRRRRRRHQGTAGVGEGIERKREEGNGPAD
jgi:hypothetical protein